MALAAFHWLLLYLVVGGAMRWFTVKFPDNPISDVFLFVHG